MRNASGTADGTILPFQTILTGMVFTYTVPAAVVSNIGVLRKINGRCHGQEYRGQGTGVTV